MDIVQYNGDNTNYANITVGKLCSVMEDTSLGSPLTRLAKLNTLYMAGYGESCIDYKYKKMIRELRQVGLTSSVADGGKDEQIYIYLFIYVQKRIKMFFFRSPVVLSRLQ